VLAKMQHGTCDAQKSHPWPYAYDSVDHSSTRKSQATEPPASLDATRCSTWQNGET